MLEASERNKGKSSFTFDRQLCLIGLSYSLICNPSTLLLGLFVFSSVCTEKKNILYNIHNIKKLSTSISATANKMLLPYLNISDIQEQLFIQQNN